MSDPYATLARTFSGARGGAPWVEADVVRADPLEVEYGGVVLDEEDLVVNAALLKNPSNVDAQLKGLVLKPGDTVVLIPDREGQRFLLLAKVVATGE